MPEFPEIACQCYAPQVIISTICDYLYPAVPSRTYRGWFIAIGYQIPFEGGRPWQQRLTEFVRLRSCVPALIPGSRTLSPQSSTAILLPMRTHYNPYLLKQKNLVPPGLEPGTFRVLSERDNHYTMELHAAFPGDASDYKPEHGSLLPKSTNLML